MYQGAGARGQGTQSMAQDPKGAARPPACFLRISASRARSVPAIAITTVTWPRSPGNPLGLSVHPDTHTRGQAELQPQPRWPQREPQGPAGPSPSPAPAPGAGPPSCGSSRGAAPRPPPPAGPGALRGAAPLRLGGAGRRGGATCACAALSLSFAAGTARGAPW